MSLFQHKKKIGWRLFFDLLVEVVVDLTVVAVGDFGGKFVGGGGRLGGG